MNTWLLIQFELKINLCFTLKSEKYTKEEEIKYETLNQWIINVLFHRFHFQKKYVALIMFCWVNISISY